MERDVVGAAIWRGDLVLIARRRHPAGWEFPGGKVEPGESREAAVVREIGEELSIDVEVLGWLPGVVAIRPGLNLTVAVARPRDAAEPVSAEHSELRWVRPESIGQGDLASDQWLRADRPFLRHLRPPTNR